MNTVCIDFHDSPLRGQERKVGEGECGYKRDRKRETNQTLNLQLGWQGELCSLPRGMSLDKAESLLLSGSMLYFLREVVYGKA